MEHRCHLAFPWKLNQTKCMTSVEHLLRRISDCLRTHNLWNSYKSIILISQTHKSQLTTYALLSLLAPTSHLITSLEPVIMGPHGGPVVVHTKLGLNLQQPASLVPTQQKSISCTLTCSKSELLKHVERLWQIVTLSYVNEKTVTRSKQDYVSSGTPPRQT